MKTDHNIRLTSAELANLWSSYMSDSMAICVFKYFMEKVEDTEVERVLEYAMHLSQTHIQRLSEIFTSEDHPIPHGFTKEDVNMKAPRLFSDTYFLHYLKHMSRVGLNAHSLAVAMAARSDILDFHNEALASSSELNNRVTQVLLSKGLYIRPPYISIPQKIEYVKKEGFLGHLMGEQRPLLAVEISHLYANLQTNAIGKALVTGFSQVAQSKEVRKYMFRGKDIAKKHIEVLGKVLTEGDLPAAMTWDSDILDSTVPPFSDKLMMFHTGALNSVGVADYGASMAISLRKDLAMIYSRLAGEVGLYANDGAKIMIDRGWMEQPPQDDDRKALARI